MATEKRLIYAGDLKNVVTADINRIYALRLDGVGPLSRFLDQIDQQPTIDAELVVHGRWIRKGNKNECDQCGFFYYSTRADYRRCPMCEAKMGR